MSPQKKKKVNGFIAVDKPRGPTSNEVLQDIKKKFKIERMGHAGTLDPLATGLLILCAGEATKFARFLIDSDKAYTAKIVLGEATDTYDATGVVTEKQSTFGITEASVERALDKFRGAIRQKPPMYSAKRIRGKRLYEFARQDKEIERQEVPVEIYMNKLLSFEENRLSLEIACSKGTYIRSIAHEVGKVLGCGAHLSGLRRTVVGKFSEHDMVSTKVLARSVSLEPFVMPVGSALSHLPDILLDHDNSRRLLSGRHVELGKATRKGQFLVYETSIEGQKRFIGVGEVDGDGVLRSKRMIALSRDR